MNEKIKIMIIFWGRPKHIICGVSKAVKSSLAVPKSFPIWDEQRKEKYLNNGQRGGL